MRMTRWLFAAAVVAGIATSGCYYHRPNVEQMFADTYVGMTKDEVVKALGQPTLTRDNELQYNYDDPLRPVRLRYILDEQSVVIEKFLETKPELAKRAEEELAQQPAIKPMPGEEKRTYPGGPLPRFEKKPGVGGY